MAILTPEEALQKRDQLVNDGFCKIPGVLSGSFLEEMRQWTDGVLGATPVPHKQRYQGSDIHVVAERRFQKEGLPNENAQHSPMVDRLTDLAAAWEACRMIGLEGQAPHDYAIILSKPPGGPALYWHQDWMNWNSPASLTPWPTTIFISYYLTDTTRENGCLRVIPGTHRRRIPLHDLLPDAHEAKMQSADESHPAFMNHPDAVDVPCKAGDLAINDARVLHSAWPNCSDQRRTLVLQWHSVFPFPNPPSWWTGEIPEEIKNADPNAVYEGTRTPGKYLRP